MGKKTKSESKKSQTFRFHRKWQTLYLLTTNNFVWLQWSPISSKPSTSLSRRTSFALGFPTHTSQVQNLWRRMRAESWRRWWNLGRRRPWNLGRRRRLGSKCETRAWEMKYWSEVETCVFTYERGNNTKRVSRKLKFSLYFILMFF